MNNNNTISDDVFDIMHEYKLALRSTLKAKKLGLNGMYVKCLSFIYHTDNSTANDIVVYFSRDKAQVARLIKEMIENKLLVKIPNNNDKRSYFLALTAKGAELAEIIVQAQSRLRLQMKQNLSDKEIEEFNRVARILRDNLKNKEL